MIPKTIKAMFNHLNNKYFWFLLLLFSFPQIINAQEKPEELFKKANELYQEKQYKEAVAIYENIYKKGYQSAELLYNIGNACYRNGDMPKAILYYEKAKLLSPKDEDLLHNLKMANLSVTDKIEPLPELGISRVFRGMVSTYSSGEWAVWAVALLWMSLSAAAIYYFSRQRSLKKGGFFLALFSFFLFAAFLFMASQRKTYENKEFAIVFSPVSYVKTSPEEQSRDAFYLHAGTKIEIRETIGDWSYIRLADGKTGWLKSTEIEKI